MDRNRSIVPAQEILLDFARLTGLDPPHNRPRSAVLPQEYRLSLRMIP